MNDPLTPERWRRVNELFHGAADQPPLERAAWLDARCGHDRELRAEVESLLASDTPAAEDAEFAHVVGDAIALVASSTTGLLAAQRVGPYRILHEIGHGGMATVFLAVRDDDEFQQRVAIKVVRGVLSGDALRRFRAERQILASLEHPSIARLLDGGTTPDGVPYLVMEYVEGAPIDRYCIDGQLPVRDRLQLFCRVCDAVSHAHRSLVVHRDIKPSNILVTPDGTPKLLDFGIAKLLTDAGDGSPATATGLRALTPEYASPEQIRGEPITTASDVYSLGVLLFEMLTAERPLSFATRPPGEIERIVCNVEPRKPSTVVPPGRLARELAGDVDTIVLTALRKEPVRRYQSPARMAEDVRRHLDGLPVVARPATWRYRSGRFIRRHRAGVGAAVVFAGVVVAFAVALARQVERVSRERDTAEHVSALLLELYSSYDPAESRGSSVTAQEVLDRGASRIQIQLKDRPELQARMLDAIGSLYTAIGVPDRATAVLKDALRVHESRGGDTLAAARTLNQMATALREQEHFADAEVFARRALEIRRRLAGPRAAETAEALNTLGLLQTLRGNVIEGASLIAQAVGIWRVTKGPDSEEFASGLRSLLRTWSERADYQKAAAFDRADLLRVERFERELLAARRKTLGDVHPMTANSLSSLGRLLHAMHRESEAEPVLREALSARRALVGRDDHQHVVEAMSSLAQALHDQGRLAEAEPLYRDVVRLVRRNEPVPEPQLAIHINNLATLFEAMMRYDEAEAAYREAIAVRRRLPASERPGVARTLNNLAALLLKRGRAADALPIVDEAIAIRRAAFGDSHPETIVSIRLRDSILEANAADVR